MTALEKKVVGSWIVHHSRKLDEVNDHGSFGRIRVAGKSSLLLSALSADDELTINRSAIEGLAQANGVDPTFELEKVLSILEEHRYIDLSANGSAAVLGVSSSRILEHAADIYLARNPTAQENAAISLAELASTEPVEESEARSFIADSCKLSKEDAVALIQTAAEIGFTDIESIDNSRRMLFNGNLFRKASASKTRTVLDSLTARERAAAQSMQDMLKQRGCVSLEDAQKVLGETLFSKLQSIGAYDMSFVSNEIEERYYVTLPSAFNKYSDPTSDTFDLAKALVAALRYGVERSAAGRGQITMLQRLVAKLVRGAWVGPATAIGHDYKILEVKGVLEIKNDGALYSMRLMKREVGEMAQQVLLEGDASEAAMINVPRSVATAFRGPEVQRSITRKKQLGLGQKGLAQILVNLRTGRSTG